MAKQAKELRYPVRLQVVFKYFGQLCLVLAVLSMVPLTLSFIFGDMTISLRYGIVICGLVAIVPGARRSVAGALDTVFYLR